MNGLNLELTTRCPLRCPQCYCSLGKGKDLSLGTAKKRIKEAVEHGVRVLNLSGGETLCYPDLYELISYASSFDIEINVALSGWKFTQVVLDRLIDSGVDGISISLNGSTSEINAVTRDGYDYAINALELLKNNKYKNTYVNWVMHSNNCDDFENVVKLVESYDVSNLVILSFKPDSSHQLKSFPTGEQIVSISQIIKKYRGKVQIVVESCFSQLLAVCLDTVLLGNLNVGPTKGCRAAIYNYSINVDGYFSPCRHLDYFEEYNTLDEYLANSSIVAKIRDIEKDKKKPCSDCYYSEYCRPCLAVTSKLHNDLYIGHEVCSVWQTKPGKK